MSRRQTAVVTIASLGVAIVLWCSSSPTEQRSISRIAPAVSVGDVVFFRTTTWRGRFVRALQGDSDDFTHVGIVVDADTNALRVVHASPIEPAIVRVVLLADLLKKKEVTSAVFYRPAVKRSEARTAASIAARYAARKVPFDFEFELADDRAVYCTELIWLSYRGAGLKIKGSRKILFPADLVHAGFLVPLGELRRPRGPHPRGS